MNVELSSSKHPSVTKRNEIYSECIENCRAITGKCFMITSLDDSSINKGRRF